ncbi:MAG TPA: VCBS repeat-containing protein [Verrucomicrobiae bacterium]|nr:VCBS repeat-containing protein [Verrucomicrobiae bacterium]
MKINILAAMIMASVALTATPLSQANVARLVSGVDEGSSGSTVKVFTARTHTEAMSIVPYTPSFSGGVRVAVGDVNGDGAPDLVTGSGPGAAHVKAFSGRDESVLRSFLPYSGFSGGVFVAAGDVNGDGRDDIITGADATAAPHVKVFDGATGTELASFFAYAVGFTGGVRVAAGDVNGDGRADIITGTGAGAAPHVKVFDGSTGAEIRSFFAFAAAFTGGVFVAAGDIDGDGLADIIVGAGPGGGPHVKVFSGATTTELLSFFPYAAGFSGGVRVASGDLDGDGRAELVTAPGAGALPEVRVFAGSTTNETAGFLAYPVTVTNGVFVGAASLKRPRLEISRVGPDVRLQWPVACVCELEINDAPGNPNGWSATEVRTTDDERTAGLLVPAVQKVRLYRLNCDDEKVR